jgi:putative hydrolase of the HAD superfamily
MDKNNIASCKGILMDLDHTLYDYDPCHKAGMKAVFDWMNITFGIAFDDLESAFSKSRKHINKSLMETASSHNRILYFQRMLETLQLPSLQHSITLYNLYWDTFLDKIKLDEGVLDTLQEFKALKKKICLLTDLTAHIQHRKLHRLGIFNLLDYMVTSEEAGREKPDPVMFSLALNKLTMMRTEVCMIGDNFEKDIMGADNFGISSYWLNRESQHLELPESSAEIKSFSELLNHARA